MNFEAIRNLIESHREIINLSAFGKGVSEEWIEKAEVRLGVSFPPSYRWWLRNYKGGEINGCEIFSVYELDFDSVVGGDVVYMNELERKDGTFASNQLVIQHSDFGEDYFFALDECDANGECPVYVAPMYQKYADNFLQFLEKKINE